MFKSNNILFVDTISDEDFLALNGEPVWTVKNLSELGELQKLAKIFGSTVKKVTGRAENLIPGKEVVVGFGKETREAGLLYAHLTKRIFRSIESKKELFNDKMPAILIIDPQLIDVELLEFLYTPRKDIISVTGLIFSENPEQLRRQVLLRTAAAHLNGELESFRIDVHPTLQFGHKEWTGVEFMGGMASSNTIRAAVGRGTGLLTISTHSDGVDTKLGKDLTLCPMLEIPKTTSMFFSPVCQTTQFCHRHHLSVSEFLRSDKLLPPEDIAARIFIFNSCYGLRLQSGMIDIGWSLARRFSNSSSLGAIVTTWEVVITKANQTAFLAHNLLEGMSVGEAVALYNKSSEAKILGRHRLCLLGDPRVKLPAVQFNPGESGKSKTAQKEKGRERNNPDAKRSEKIDIIESISKIPLSQVEFFDVCFTFLVRHIFNDHELLFINRALTKIGEYKESIRKKSSKKYIEARRSEMLLAILNHLIDQNSLFYSTWIPLTDKFSTYTSVEKCKVCQQPVTITNAKIKLSKTFLRRLVICPNCGIIEDSPAALKLEISLDNQTLKLHGKLPRKKILVKVLLQISNIDSDDTVWDWQLVETDKTEHSFDIPDIYSPGLAIISVVIVWTEGYVILKQLTRAFQKNPAEEAGSAKNRDL